MDAASAFSPYQAPSRLEETQAVCPGPCNVALQISVGLGALQGDPLLVNSICLLQLYQERYPHLLEALGISIVWALSKYRLMSCRRT